MPTKVFLYMLTFYAPGKQATANASQSLEYGTNIVGGVTPGRNGEHLGLPVLPTVRTAKEQLKPDATAVFVAARHAGKAIEEAIEAELPLIVAVAEHIPIHDVLRIHSMLRTQSISRLVGPNSPGIISPIGKCRIGFQPLPTFSAGCIGIAAKSGTLSYETVASTTRANLGQSLVIGVGGDLLPGTSFVDALRVLEHDDLTKGIIIVGEIGGQAEQEAAEWIKLYRKRTKNPKPIMGLVAGLEAAPDRIMGHAGAFVGPGEVDAAGKIRLLEEAGVLMVNHPSMFGTRMKTLLEKSTLRPPSPRITTGSTQQRAFYTCHKGLLQGRYGHSRITSRPLAHTKSRPQRRALWLKQFQALDLLQRRDIPVSTNPSLSVERFLLTVTIDRTSFCPCIVAARLKAAGEDSGLSRSFPFDYRSGLDQSIIPSVKEHLEIRLDCQTTSSSISWVLQELVSLFLSKEAFILQTEVAVQENGSLEVQNAKFGFDDAAFKSGRQTDIHRMRNIQEEDPKEMEAEKEGLVYIKLGGAGKIGTLVNGAGLAMNTNDALASYGAKCANFLDTGGRANSDTVKSSFRVILQDSRVKAIFVNIFGGLTRCDMIAEGIMMAFKDLNMSIPVVVRLRGTNEDIGQKRIADSGLPLHAFDDFEDATKKVIELTGGAK